MSDNDAKDKIRKLMRESIPDKPNVVDFAAAAARKAGRSEPRHSQGPTHSMQITGNNNAGVFGNSNHIQITVRGAQRPRIQVMPGPDEVTNTQAAEVKRLVAKVVEVSGVTFSSVYSAVYRRFDTTSYHLIKKDKYDEVVRYLHKWIASVAPTMALDAEAERKQLLKKIHAQARKMQGGIDLVHAFIHGRFGTSSLADLMPGQLREVIKQFKM